MLTKICILFLAALNVLVVAKKCPDSCPLIQTLNGPSSCCEFGDESPNCGTCDSSTCFSNGLEICSKIPGANCDVHAPGCNIVSLSSKIIYILNFFIMNIIYYILNFLDSYDGGNRFGVVVGGEIFKFFMKRFFFFNNV